MKSLRSHATLAAKIVLFVYVSISPAPSAFAQAVSVGDLYGTTFNFPSVIKGGWEIINDYHTSGHIMMMPGNTGTFTSANSVTFEHGSRSASPRSGTFTLGKAYKNDRDADIVWIFESGRSGFAYTAAAAGRG